MPLLTEIPLLTYLRPLIAMRATLVAEGPGGEREIPIDDFFKGFLETDLAPEELLTEIRIPKAGGAKRSFQKFNRRAQDWAIVGASVLIPKDKSQAGVGLVNMGSIPLRADAVEAAVGAGKNASEAAEVAHEGCDPTADLKRQH